MLLRLQTMFPGRYFTEMNELTYAMAKFRQLAEGCFREGMLSSEGRHIYIVSRYKMYSAVLD